MNFETLDLLLEYIPTVKNTLYVGEKHIYEDYSGLVDKLVKYTVNERDNDIKPFYYATLKKLVDKTTFNFRMEYESAISHK